MFIVSSSRLIIIALINLYSPLKDNLKTRIIVAGGAGGTGTATSGTINIGGKGGGRSGTKGQDSNSNNPGGGPGNQASGGTSFSKEVGSFGFGGNRSSENGCGGGGGWFGGGSGNGGLAAGGGGSGFIFINEDPNIELDTRFQLISGQTEEGINTGDGKIIIDVLEISLQNVKIKFKLFYLPFFLSESKTTKPKHNFHFVKTT